MRNAKPKSRLEVAIAVAPFGAATLLAWVAVLVGTSIDWLEYAIATLLVVLVGLLPLTNWRAVRFGSVASALLYLAAVAMLRDAAGGFSSGVGVLSSVPVFYVALYSSRRTLVAVIGGLAVFYIAPILLIGPPDYPTSQYRVALLAVTVSSIIGLTTQGLVRRGRLGAFESQEQKRMLGQVNDLVRSLFESPQARTDICEAARRIGEAASAALYEPVGTSGSMRSTAMAGFESNPIEVPAGGGSPVGKAFLTGKTALLTEGVEERVSSKALWEASGRPTSILYEPLLRGSKVVGVLVVGWKGDVVLDGPRVTVISLLANEAANVIHRSDLLRELTVNAETDPLTGLPNRRTWDAGIEQALDRGATIAVAILDLDHFKAYNDSEGHQAGDRLLKETTAAWRGQLRAGDLLARIGGEEFALLLANCEAGRANEVIDRLRANVSQEQTCSAGFATQRPGESGAEVMKRADAALYEAKAKGRNRICIAA